MEGPHTSTSDCRDGIGDGKRLLVISAGCLIAAAFALFLDLELSRHCMLGRLPGDIRKFLTITELFAHGAGVLLLGLAVLVLDPDGRSRCVRLLGAAYGVGILALMGKLLIGRSRPRAFDFEHDIWHSYGDTLQLVLSSCRTRPSRRWG